MTGRSIEASSKPNETTDQPVLRPGPAIRVTSRASRTSARTRRSTNTSNRKAGTINGNSRAERTSPPRPANAVVREERSFEPVKGAPSKSTRTPKRSSSFRKAYLKFFGTGDESSEKAKASQSQTEILQLQRQLLDATKLIEFRDERIVKLERENKKLRRKTRALTVGHGTALHVVDGAKAIDEFPDDSEGRLLVLRKQSVRILELESALDDAQAKLKRGHPAPIDISRPHFEDQLKDLRKEFATSRDLSGKVQDNVKSLSDSESISTVATHGKVSRDLWQKFQQLQKDNISLRNDLQRQTEQHALEIDKKTKIIEELQESRDASRSLHEGSNIGRRRTLRQEEADSHAKSILLFREAELQQVKTEATEAAIELEASKLALADSMRAREKLEVKLRSSKRLLRKALAEAEKAKTPEPIDGAPRTADNLATANEHIRQLTAKMRLTSEAREDAKVQLDSAQLELTRLLAERDRQETSRTEFGSRLSTVGSAGDKESRSRQSRQSAEDRIMELTAQVERQAAMRKELVDISAELDILSAEVKGVKVLKSENRTLRKENKRLSEQLLQFSLVDLETDDLNEEELEQYINEHRYSAIELSTARAQPQQTFVSAKIHQYTSTELDRAKARIKTLEDERLKQKHIQQNLEQQVSVHADDADKLAATQAQFLEFVQNYQVLQQELQASKSMAHSMEAQLAVLNTNRDADQAGSGSSVPTSSELARVREENTTLLSRLETLNMSKEQFNLEKQDLYSQLEKSQEEVRSAQDRADRMNRQLEKMATEREDRESQIKSAQTKIEALQNEFNQRPSDSEAGSGDRSARERISVLEDQLRTLETAQTHLRDSEASLQAKTQQLESKSHIETELAERCEEVEHLRSKLEQLPTLEQVEELRRQAEAAEQLKGSSSNAQQRLAEFQVELQGKRSLEEERQTEIEALKRGLAALRAEMEVSFVSKENLERVKKQLAAETWALQEAKNTHKELLDLLEKKDNQHKKAQKSMLELGWLVEQAKTEAVTHKAVRLRKEELENTVSVLQRDHKRLKAQLKEMSVLQQEQQQQLPLRGAQNQQISALEAEKKALQIALEEAQERWSTHQDLQTRLKQAEVQLANSRANQESLVRLQQEKADLEVRLQAAEESAAGFAHRLSEAESVGNSKSTDTESQEGHDGQDEGFESERRELQEEVETLKFKLDKQRDEAEIEQEALQMQIAAFEQLSGQFEDLERELQSSKDTEVELRALLEKSEATSRAGSEVGLKEGRSEDAEEDDDPPIRPRRYAPQLESVTEEDESGDWMRSNYDHRERVTPEDVMSLPSPTASGSGNDEFYDLENEIMGNLYQTGQNHSSADVSANTETRTYKADQAKVPKLQLDTEHLEERTRAQRSASPNKIFDLISPTDRRPSSTLSRHDSTGGVQSPTSGQFSTSDGTSRPHSSASSSQDLDNPTSRIPRLMRSRPSFEGKPLTGIKAPVQDRIMHYETLSTFRPKAAGNG